jgi:hypothetical protein
MTVEVGPLRTSPPSSSATTASPGSPRLSSVRSATSGSRVPTSATGSVADA